MCWPTESRWSCDVISLWWWWWLSLFYVHSGRERAGLLVCFYFRGVLSLEDFGGFHLLRGQLASYLVQIDAYYVGTEYEAD